MSGLDITASTHTHTPTHYYNPYSHTPMPIQEWAAAGSTTAHWMWAPPPLACSSPAQGCTPSSQAALPTRGCRPERRWLAGRKTQLVRGRARLGRGRPKKNIYGYDAHSLRTRPILFCITVQHTIHPTSHYLTPQSMKEPRTYAHPGAAHNHTVSDKDKPIQ